ncbi:TraR/DksA C4-type zinc finger protein [Pseudomonas sp. 148P]|uniref:TraR/DksA C4-type zinc finger protein n=1 Tax=Pseudomonas ulcerans TaxID=3115852 RepID=A0ABU7HVZ2_9PSED|nr:MULTISPECIES: TraR/DksA C4-type zinc finger protein [unclassified Pseudomonas]MEE1922887.1 TraR/DksA C4-type zinc finger protein [Pseudomonas sp. 147P]MEE1935737.1 TraR/DksA C4-type zinc finger protein [Pseudomonas sp. 148P]
MDNFADPIDQAAEQSERFLQAALQRHVNRPVKPSAQFCEDCDEAIPLARQEAAPGCDTCIDCQDLRERRR